MFHDITIVHLFFLSAFAAIGLKGIVHHRGEKVSFALTVAGETAVRVTLSDIIFLFSVLAVMSLDDTSIEFLNWVSAHLKSGARWASVVVLSAYWTALVCAFVYALTGVVAVISSGVAWIFRKGRTSFGK